MDGGSKVNEASARLGIPIELLQEAENFRDQSGEIYPDNLLSVQVFYSILRQWRVGFNGPIGLDYNVIPFAFKMHGVKKKRQPEVFSDLRIMETAVLKHVNS